MIEMDKTKIKTLIKQVRGVSYKPDDLHNELNGDSVILLRANNIDDGKINFDDVVYVDKSKVSDEQYLRKGDILICASSGSKNLVGKAASVDFDRECTFGAFCKAVRPNEDVVDYLGVYFQSPVYRRKISEVAIGANINNIRNEHIDELEVPLFSRDEQQEIVKKIQLVLDIISKRKDEITSLEDLIRARFVELFGEYYMNHINEKQLDEICDFIDYRGKTPEKSESGIPLITAKNVKDNRFSIEPQEFIPEENYDAVMTRGIPRVNDVLFTTEAPLGNVCRIPDIYERFCVGQRLITMQPHTDVINSEYLEHALASAEFQEKMWQKSSGSTVKGIRSKLLVLLTIPVPPIELQNQFRDFVHQVDKSKVVVQKALDETQLLFDSLMQEYFG